MDRLQLTQLPPELLIKIYASLPSFLDAFNLRSTCRILRNIWTSHKSGIVNELGVRTIECYPYARQIIYAQRAGPPVDQSDLCDVAILNLLRNARRVENVVLHIERESIPKLVVSSIPDSKKSTIYGGSGIHPPTLTPTERLRVIRVCYRIWSFWLSFSHLFKPKISSLRPREILYVSQIAEAAYDAKFPIESIYSMYFLVEVAQEVASQLYSDTYGCAQPQFRDRTTGEQVPLFVLWDHCQNDLKNFICRRPAPDSGWDEHAAPLDHLWDYEEGDEWFIADE